MDIWFLWIFSYPGNTGNLIFLISHILEILEIVFSYFLISWKYWKMDFLYFLISWKYWKLRSATFSITWKYGRRAGGGGRAAPGVVLCCLGLFLEHVPGKTSMVTLELRSNKHFFEICQGSKMQFFINNWCFLKRYGKMVVTPSIFKKNATWNRV